MDSIFLIIQFNKVRIRKMRKNLNEVGQNRDIKKQLFKTVEKQKAEKVCQYCEMKRKFGLGGSGDQKCFEHSVKKEFQTHETNDKSMNEQQGYLNAEDMVDALEEVNDGLDHYWNNLHELSQGNTNRVLNQLQPVLESVKRIQEKLGKFFIENEPIEVSEIKRYSEQSPLKKYQCTGSQKFARQSISNMFDNDDFSPTESIKEWVMHFYKVLQTRQANENEEEELPYQDELEMRIFKQSLERKYLASANELSRHEKKLQEVLSKLIFYMEKSTDVPSEQIEADIKFIENQEALGAEAKETSLQHLLFLQASSIEHLLQQHS